MAEHAGSKGAPILPARSRTSASDRDGPKPRGRRPGIRLAVVLAVLAILSVWLGTETIRAWRQRAVVHVIWDLGGYVWRAGDRPEGQPVTPRWYRSLLGEDFLNPVVAVRLAGTDASDEHLVQIGTLTKLQMLDLRDTRISDVGLGHLRRLSRLKVLILTGTAVSGKGLASLKNMPELTVLCLEETNVTDEGLAQLRWLTSVRWLDLGGTGITDSGLRHLKECPLLEVLILDRCAATREGLTGLERALPLTIVCDGTTRLPSIDAFCAAHQLILSLQQ